MLLANFGAEVIKVEEVKRGDHAREMTPLINSVGAYFLLTNGGKKSVALDLKNSSSRDAFLRLVERADVLVEGFRPGVMERLGLNYEVLRKRNPRLIYAAITGYGQDGPYAPLAGHDINYLSLGGILDLNRAAEDDAPTIPGVQVADLAGGSMPAVIGILLALAARQKTGEGQMIDVAMLDGVVSLLAVPLAHHAAAVRSSQRPAGEMLLGDYACYHIYRARDGKWLSVGALEPKFWDVLCRTLNCERFIPEQYAPPAMQATIIAALGQIFLTRDSLEWFEIFSAKDACVAPVRNISELLTDEHLRVREMFVSREHPGTGVIENLGVTPKLSETPGQVSSDPPPRLGEHTREVLLWAGLSAAEIEALEQQGLIRVWR